MAENDAARRAEAELEAFAADALPEVILLTFTIP